MCFREAIQQVFKLRNESQMNSMTNSIHTPPPPPPSPPVNANNIIDGAVSTIDGGGGDEEPRRGSVNDNKNE